MKLNKTYNLRTMLDALTSASDDTKKLAEQLKAEGRHSQVFTVYEPEGMLSTSPFARVTLTHKVSDTRWEGYMETIMKENSPKTPVAVNRSKYTLIANEDFTQFTIQM